MISNSSIQTFTQKLTTQPLNLKKLADILNPQSINTSPNSVFTKLLYLPELITRLHLQNDVLIIASQKNPLRKIPPPLTLPRKTLLRRIPPKKTQPYKFLPYALIHSCIVPYSFPFRRILPEKNSFVYISRITF